METRLRKQFKYPEEEDEPEAMDEEEQEKFIKQLRKENTEKNEEWIRLFLGLVMTCLALYLPILVAACRAPPRYVAIMGITSLLATAYNLVLIPNKHGGRDPLAKFAASRDLELSPLQQYLPYLNAVLALLVGISCNSWIHETGIYQAFWLVGWMPAIMYGIIFVVKRFLVEVDPEDLEKIRYEWKGA